MENEYTAIPVKQTTKEKLDQNTTKDMTYDDKVKALLDFWIRYKDVVNK